VRFGIEIGGVMELGMAGRGEHSEILSFVGKSVDSELSGNMIDLCPVGALTSKPFRYAARTWELARRRSVSPHDGLGSNLIVQVKGGAVMRVLPLENEAVNECWITDKDRFSYPALASEERLTAPMVKRNGEWHEVAWPEALDTVVRGLKDTVERHGAGALGTLVSPHSTLEEMGLAARLTRALGSENVDFRLRQTDFRADAARPGIPWLGMPIAEVSRLKHALVVGSFLRKDQPLLAARLRLAANRGTKVSMLHSVDDAWLIRTAAKHIVAPSLLPRALAEVVVAAARTAGRDVPQALHGIEAGEGAQALLDALTGDGPKAIFLGNYALQHPAAAEIEALATTLAELTGATLGVLTEAANTVGGHLVNALPGAGGRSAAAMLGSDPCRAYIVLHAEPELDCAQPVAAREALDQADFVVVMSPFRHGTPYADVLLPVSPFTETAGSFVNCEGRLQAFKGVVPPLRETRPAWKVLRVLGTMLDLPGFDLDDAEAVRASVLPQPDAIGSRLGNGTRFAPATPAPTAAGVERVADVPIYFADPLVRRSDPLQRTADARPPRARMHRALFEQLGLAAGDQVRVRQGRGEAVLTAEADASVPPGVVRIAAAHPSTCGLDGLSGPVTVERA
jgi:NADH-quinone oxidoreductase subunit G